MMNRIAFLCLIIGITGSLACVGPETDDEPDEIEETGVKMVVDIPYTPGIQGIQVSIFECGVDRPLLVDQTALDMGTLPDARPDRDDIPFADGAEHLFADYFAALDSGCYDVEIAPVDDRGEMVLGCTAAVAHDIKVKKKSTTEILLVSQCDEATDPSDVAGEIEKDKVLDVIAAINHPPEIEMVEALPSMSLKCPSAAVELCAKVVEPDHDPVVFEWIQLEGPRLVSGPTETHFDEVDGITTKCVEYEFADQTADYLFELTVFDYFEVDGDLITAEQWFLREDYGAIDSHDTAVIPLHVDCPKEKMKDDYEEDVAGEIEDDKKKKDDYEEDVAGEIEDDKKKKDDYEEDVAGEIEDDKKKKDDEKKKKKDDYEEDVAGEIEDDKKKKDDYEEDVAGEIEDDKKKKDDEKKKKKDDYEA